jgi:ubiquinone biosynthesis protein UbiJ
MDPAAALANRILEGEDWARQRLAEHAGRSFSVTVGPLGAAMRIDAAGRLATVSPRDVAPDVALEISPFALPALLVDPTRWGKLVAVTGDAGFAAALEDLAQTIPWFVERLFARLFGPIAGQRAADAGRSLLGFPEYALERIGASVASYARDEAQVAAHPAAFRRFADDTAALAARVETLAERVDALATRLPDTLHAVR